MLRRALFVLTGIVVVAGLAFALFAFPTRYKCLGDDLTFTTSRAYAIQVCAEGDKPHDVVSEHQLAPGLAAIACALLVAAILLRVATRETDEAPATRAGIE